jgi:hypothetical protein
MSVAVPIDQPRPDLIEHGVVAVYNYRFAHSVAACSCGWTARRRFIKAAAQQDAWVHSMHDKCTVSFPLVIPVSASGRSGGEDLLQQLGFDVAAGQDHHRAARWG